MMNKIDHVKINRANNDIWSLLRKAIKTNNMALLETNLERLYKMQAYYMELLQFQESEVLFWKHEYMVAQKNLNEYEKDMIVRASSSTSIHEEIRKRVEQGWPYK